MAGPRRPDHGKRSPGVRAGLRGEKQSPPKRPAVRPLIAENSRNNALPGRSLPRRPPDRDPVAADRDPVAADRDPVAADRDPVAMDRDPVAAARDPVATVAIQSLWIAIQSLRVAIQSLRVAIQSLWIAIQSLRVAIQSLRVAIQSLWIAIQSLPLAIQSLWLAIQSQRVAIQSLQISSRKPRSSQVRCRSRCASCGNAVRKRWIASRTLRDAVRTLERSEAQVTPWNRSLGNPFWGWRVAKDSYRPAAGSIAGTRCARRACVQRSSAR